MGTVSTVDPRRKDEIDGALKMVMEMHEAKALSEGAYHKLLVSIAYEYVMADEDQLALVLIAKPTIEYYEVVQPQQMEEDAMYRDLVILLSYRLLQMGVINGLDETKHTQAPANA